MRLTFSSSGVPSLQMDFDSIRFDELAEADPVNGDRQSDPCQAGPKIRGFKHVHLQPDRDPLREKPSLPILLLVLPDPALAPIIY